MNKPTAPAESWRILITDNQNQMKNTILEIPIKDITVDITLSGRTQKEITANAKDLAPKLAAFGGFDATQPGAVFKRDGKWHLARGFTRVAAALSEDIKVGYFMEVPDDVANGGLHFTLRLHAGPAVRWELVAHWSGRAWPRQHRL